MYIYVYIYICMYIYIYTQYPVQLKYGQSPSWLHNVGIISKIEMGYVGTIEIRWD